MNLAYRGRRDAFMEALRTRPLRGETWTIYKDVTPTFPFCIEDCHFILRNGACFNFTSKKIVGFWFCDNYLESR